MWAQLRSRGPCGCERTWLMLLLSGHVLGLCFRVTQAAPNLTVSVRVEPWPPYTGADVSLIPDEGIQDAVSCSWYRWDTSEKNMILVYEPTTSTVKHSKGYTGRETVSSDCSLHIMNLSVLDITFYIMRRNSTTASEVGQAFLVVSEGMPQIRNYKLSGEAIAGIFILCLIVLTALVTLVTFKIFSSSAG